MYDFTAMDFEIANNNMNSACSIGLAAVKDLKIVNEEYFLIKPPTLHFRHENTEIHGISPDDVKDSPIFPEIYPIIKNYIECSDFVISHNAQFDMSVLHECLNTYNIKLPDFVYMDSINFSAKMRENCGNSLEKCAQFFGIDMGEHHNALADARTCANIVIATVHKSRFKTVNTYANNSGRVHKKSFLQLKPNKVMQSSRKFETIRIGDLSTDKTEFDCTNPFYDKNCVFTGELQALGRKEAMQKILDVGGHIKSSVSSKTHFLIVGIQDKKLVGEDGLSTKEEKAHALIDKGIDIRIINEDEFLELLSNL